MSNLLKAIEEKIKKQIVLQGKIQNAGFNIVNCGSFGNVVLHELKAGDIECLIVALQASLVISLIFYMRYWN